MSIVRSSITLRINCLRRKGIPNRVRRADRMTSDGSA